MTNQFQFIVSTLPGFPEPSLAIAASRAEELGVLDLTYTDDFATAWEAARKLADFARNGYGYNMRDDQHELLTRLLTQIAPAAHTLILSGGDEAHLRTQIALAGEHQMRVLLQATSLEQAKMGVRLGVAGIIAKGSESGGRVGAETTFILLQKLLKHISLPVYAHGGIGEHTAAACCAAGAAGVMLDSQLTLLRESRLPSAIKEKIRGMDSRETVCLGAELGELHRFYAPPDAEAVTALREVLVELAAADSTPAEKSAAWRAAIAARVNWTSTSDYLFPMGEDAIFAARLADDHLNVSGVIIAMREAIENQVRIARTQRSLDKDSSLAQSHGTTYPIAQGPTRPFGESAEFARAVAHAGALPFVALGQKKQEAVRALLEETRRFVGDKPWGACLSAGLPPALRQEQLNALRDIKPNYAMVAGDEAETALGLKNAGIPPYQYIATPQSLHALLDQGYTRFIFAGSESSQHPSHQTSFVLWNTLVKALLDYITGHRDLYTPDIHILCAGGVINDLSSAMIAALAAPVIELGVRVGFLMGTAYLFTEEAVTAQAISPAMQAEAITADNTLAAEDAGMDKDTFNLGQTAALRDSTCTLADLHEEVTTMGMQRLQTIDARWEKPPFLPRTKPSQVAIIGMACLLPGAGNLKTYWENILNSVDAVTEVPPERWDWRRYFDEDKKTRDKIYSRWGGFIDDIPFNPLDYGMPPNSVKSIEPVQLLMLDVVKSALRDAGYEERPFPREKTACVIAVGGGLGDLGTQYGFRSYVPHFLEGESDDVLERISRKLPEWTEDSFPGILLNVLAGRVANRFDLGGPNFVIDAACGSSLAALDAGVKTLENREVDMAIVGAGETVQSPFGFLAFSKTQALSPTGRCRPFDAGADGIAISEGLAVLILKRVEDAERDGDRIYAVIDAVAASSDGKDRSLTAPRPAGQMRAVRRAYAKAGVDPATVGLFEAHGTGTKVGDVAEAETLDTVLREAHAEAKSAAIGSVKSMIGHTKSTAGLAGMIKVALSLYHKVLPPTLINTPNPRLYNESSALYVNSELRPWIRHRPREVRRAGVSAFGFGGTNFHAVLQEYQDFLPAHAVRENWPLELMLFAGTNITELRAQISNLTAWLGKSDPPPLRDISYTLYRHYAQERILSEGHPLLALALVANAHDDLLMKLTEADKQLAAGKETINDPRGIYFNQNPLAREGQIAFLYPGQGSQYTDMLRDMAIQFPTVRAAFERANEAMQGKLPQSLSEYIFPIPKHDKDAQQADQLALTATNVAQPALGAANLAVNDLLQRLGVMPAFVAGHSYGEIVALYEAGVFDEADMMAVSAARGKFMAEAAGPNAGTMAAIRTGRQEVEAAVAGIPDLTLANLNAPQQTVISGTQEAIDTALARLSARNISGRPLPVACAFHSPLVAPARDQLAAFMAEQVQFHTPHRDVYANTTGTVYPHDPAEIRAILSGQLAKPVKFQQEIEAMYEAGARIFVECGPKAVLTGLVGQILGDKPHMAVAVNRQKKPGLETFAIALARLAADGVPLALETLFEGRSVTQRSFDQPYTNPERARYTATTWLINGGRARAWREAQQKPEEYPQPIKIKLEETTSVQPAPTANSAPPPPTASLPAHTPIPQPATVSPAASPRVNVMPPMQPAASYSPPAAAPQPATAATDVLLQYQQLMAQFLQTQQSIMMAYLGAAPAAQQPAMPTPAQTWHTPQAAPPPIQAPPPMAAAPAPAWMPPQAMPQPPMPLPQAAPPPQAQPAAPAPLPVAQPASPAPAGMSRETITSNLQTLVSERTGYPPELLNLEADLEADLGIDSIKRVEILSAFREQYPQLNDAFAGDRMEQLQSQRTLHGMIELLSEGATATDAPATPSTPSAPAVDATVVERNLVTLVSERTGYPPELLNIQADLEADLGIDSIKRVEILGAFRDEYKELEAAFAGDRMEQLQSQRTLQGMIALITAGLPAAQAPKSQPAPAPAGAPSINGTSTPQPAAAAPVAMNEAALTKNLVALVSERTGYPPELLNLEADLEADLGIDSIKRVEILSAFRDEHPQMETAFAGDRMEQLQSQRTLKGMIGLLTTASAPQPIAAAAPRLNGTAPMEEASPILRFKLATANAPINGNFGTLAPGRVILITDDGRGVAQELVGALQERGHVVALVAHGSEGGQEETGRFTANMTDPTAVNNLVDTIRRQLGPIGSLLHLAPLGLRRDFASINLTDWRQLLNLETGSFFYLVQAVYDDLEAAAAAGGASLLAATDLGGSFGNNGNTNPDMLSPNRGGIVGLLKTVAHELSGVRAKAVDLDRRQDTAVAAQILLQEMMSLDGLVEIGYDGESRKRLTLVPALLPDSSSGKSGGTITHDSIILITGGARGITADVARELAQRYQPTLILVGRSPMPPAQESPVTAGLEDKEIKAALIKDRQQRGEPLNLGEIEREFRNVLRDRDMRDNINGMIKTGARIHYFSADVRNEASFGPLLDELYEKFGRIDGVIHGAGIIEDKLIKDKSPESFARVLGTKADSGFILSRKLRPESLKFLVFFSSVSGRFGNRGQGDYAAANEVLNKLAVYLDHKWPTHVVSMNWGPWDAGMVSDEVRRQFKRRGVSLIPIPTGQQRLVEEVNFGRKGEVEIVICGEGDGEALAS
ncbi:MAG: SDR family NAD(P)-dependent oxidoreductase [Anaerolineales bacterium]|nr:SDR family NAD(P)-dependent oxidoreductase [Anaerolineales bacterium]